VTVKVHRNGEDLTERLTLGSQPVGGR
jgi:hypothetical protein